VGLGGRGGQLVGTWFKCECLRSCLHLAACRRHAVLVYGRGSSLRGAIASRPNGGLRQQTPSGSVRLTGGAASPAAPPLACAPYILHPALSVPIQHHNWPALERQHTLCLLPLPTGLHFHTADTLAACLLPCFACCPRCARCACSQGGPGVHPLGAGPQGGGGVPGGGQGAQPLHQRQGELRLLVVRLGAGGLHEVGFGVSWHAVEGFGSVVGIPLLACSSAAL